MAQKIKPEELASTITTLLTKYNEEVTDICKEVVDEVSKGCMEEVQSHATWIDRKVPYYSKSFRMKTSFEDKRNKRNTWYVANGNYRLTHLLEFGHVTRLKANHKGKMRTDKYPHVKYGAEFVSDNLEKRMREEIEKCKI